MPSDGDARQRIRWPGVGEAGDGRDRPVGDGRPSRSLGGQHGRPLRLGAARPAGHPRGAHAGEPSGTGGGHPRERRGRGAQPVRAATRRRPRPRARDRARRSRDGDPSGRGGVVGRRAGRRERGHVRPQGVPPGQRPEPHLSQRAMHGDHRQHGRSRYERQRAADVDRVDSRQPASRGAAAGAAPHGPRARHRRGDDEVRDQGALRTLGCRRADGPPGVGPPAPRCARGARPDVRQARTDPLHPPGPSASRVHRGARDAPGQRSAPDRGAGRGRDGGGARRSVGGRLRIDRPPADGRGDDRRGPSCDPRRRLPRGCEGAAARRSRGHHEGSRPARAVRPEDAEPPGAPADDRHAGGLRAPVGVASARARFPRRVGEHRSHADDPRALRPARRSRACTGSSRPSDSS